MGIQLPPPNAHDNQDGHPNAPHIIPAPILTCWWTVGVAAAYLVTHWDLMVSICDGIIKNTTTKDASNQIASGNWVLLQMPAIKSDIHLIAAYHKYFLFSHFSWLQKGDSNLGNHAGFLSAHIGT